MFNGDDTVLHPGDNTSGRGAFFDGDAASLSPVNASSTPLSISCWGIEEIAMAFLALGKTGGSFRNERLHASFCDDRRKDLTDA